MPCLFQACSGLFSRWRVIAIAGLFVSIDSVVLKSQTIETKANVQRSTFNVQCPKKSLVIAQVKVITDANAPETSPAPLPPSQFNPDPGAGVAHPVEPEAPPELFPPILPQLPQYGEEALPRSLELPRKGVREVVPKRRKLEYETYPDAEAGEGLLPSS